MPSLALSRPSLEDVYLQLVDRELAGRDGAPAVPAQRVAGETSEVAP
jgi:hypothetical protein